MVLKNVSAKVRNRDDVMRKGSDYQIRIVKESVYHWPEAID